MIYGKIMGKKVHLLFRPFTYSFKMSIFPTEAVSDASLGAIPKTPAKTAPASPPRGFVSYSIPNTPPRSSPTPDSPTKTAEQGLSPNKPNKKRRKDNINKKSACFKWTYGLSRNNYRVATLPKSYLTVIRISSKDWNRFVNSNMSELTKSAYIYGQTYGRTDTNYRKAWLFNN